MTPQEIDRIECAIRHIESSLDVDPWAEEIAVEAMRKQIADFDKNGKRTAESAQNVSDGDLISRKAAIESIRECAEAAHDNHEWDMEQGYLNAIECVEEEPSAQPERKKSDWIPCGERLPEEETPVLVTRKFLGVKDTGGGWNDHIPEKIYVEIAEYVNGDWVSDSDEYKIARNRHTDPIAWRPLPEPWGGEQND